MTATQDVSTALTVHSADPLCAGPDPTDLVGAYRTPNNLYYVRNHGSVPGIDSSDYLLTVDGLVARRLELSMADLKSEYPSHTLTATLQCAGNRRAELNRVVPFENEVLWSGDAIGTAAWTGVRLADVLGTAEPVGPATHVWFEGMDRARRAEVEVPFGASIELARALESDVLLAWEMNGEPLPAVHGAPLRAVVPGAIGARSVKWLARISVADRESDNHFQKNSYRTGGSAGEADRAIESAPLNSYISSPRYRALVSSGDVDLSGYAIASGTQTLSAVEISVDDEAWSPAEVIDPPAAGAWSRWRSTITLAPGIHQLRVRARDSSRSHQPEDLASAWNPRGYLNNAIHSIRIRAE